MQQGEKMPLRILVMSDIHLCHLPWYGKSAEARMEEMISLLNAEYQSSPYDRILFLGDYSLDFWQFGEGGSWLHRGLSNTRRFLEEYATRLLCPFHLIPSNHEQYGNEEWISLTGHPRQYTVSCGELVFVLLDTFAGNLSPASDSDGTYTGPALSYIRRVVAENRGKNIFLMAHEFKTEAESAEFQSLVRETPEIRALFAGHRHIYRAGALPAEWGGKPLLRTGNFSYSGEPDPKRCLCGWRTLTFSDGLMQSVYEEPARDYVFDGVFYQHEKNRPESGHGFPASSVRKGSTYG